MLAIAVLSAVASALSVVISRRWGISFGGFPRELPVTIFAGIAQGVITPLALEFGLLGIFTLGAFPVWAIFSLAHYSQWERFDGVRFAATQVALLSILLLASSFVFRPVS